jgi:glucosyl-dolichyl phosphate glucuronosyltransferase
MISIIICTHNRDTILPYCLHSLVKQTADPDAFEVIVVDNKSTDKTKEVTLAFTGKIRHLRYVVEETLGLSHARNRGFKEAKFEWVSYVDDDAKAYPDYVERAMWVIHNYKFECFGGRFMPWYLETKPAWLPADFGAFPLLKNKVDVLGPNQFAPGGVIVFKKNLLGEVGGFPANLGMTGNSVGYGEENWVQNELRKRSYTVGFDPELKIDHLVAPYKFNVRWHMKRQIARGKAARILGSVTRAQALSLLPRAIGVTVKDIVKNGVKLLTKRNYYRQNFIVDSLSFLLKTIGSLR